MQFPIDSGPGGIDIGDVEDVLIGAARKSNARRLAHRRARAITADDVGGFASLAAAGIAKLRDDTVAVVRVANELRLPLNSGPHRRQSGNEQLFVFVLGEYPQIRIGAQAHTDLLE